MAFPVAIAAALLISCEDHPRQPSAPISHYHNMAAQRKALHPPLLVQPDGGVQHVLCWRPAEVSWRLVASRVLLVQAQQVLASRLVAAVIVVVVVAVPVAAGPHFQLPRALVDAPAAQSAGLQQ